MLDRLPARFRAKIEICEEMGCWLWTGWNSGNGYGKVRWRGRAWMAHRIIFVLLGGEIPDDHVLDHLCRRRNCCNPEHLEPVTVRENTHRGDAVLFGPI